MRCALVVPAWEPGDIFSSRTAGSQINYWQPLGTLYVAASLTASGHEVRFINGAFLSHDQVIDEIVRFEPGFVGIYSTAFGWPKAVRTADDVRATGKHVFICAGGPYPIAMREACLNDSGARSIDAVVTGEGEVTVPEMVGTLERGLALSTVHGLAYRDGGEVRTTPQRPLISDLDSLAFPPRELLGDARLYIPPPATYRRKPVAVMLTSRGCNRRCIYCFQLDRTRKSGVRYRSVDNVIAEIEHCLAQGFREIKFLDDTFAADYGRAMRIAREIKARRLDFTWFVSACVNQVDEALLKAFKEAGCWAVLFGAESGVQKNLNTIKKGITLEQTRAAVAAAKRAGLTVATSFIFGIPGETFEDGLATIEFARELAPDIANFHAITPFPGTELYDNAQRYGAISDELTDYTYQGAAFVPTTMTKEEIAKLRALAFRRFYSRPQFMLRRLFAMRNANDIRAAFNGTRSLAWLWADRRALERRCERTDAAAHGGKKLNVKKGWC